MRFEQSIADGYVKKVPIDKIMAKSLLLSGDEALYAAQKLPLEQGTAKAILRELYEGLRQHCEAIGYFRGYKFRSHEAITYFIEEVLHDTALAARFDRYRKLRNGINYYGKDVSLETVKEALQEIPEIVKKLRKQIE